MSQLIHQINTQFIFSVTKIYFKSNFYDNNNARTSQNIKNIKVVKRG